MIAVGYATQPLLDGLLRRLGVCRFGALIHMQIMRYDGDLAHWPSRSFSSLAQPGEIVVEVQRRAAIHVQRAMHVNRTEWHISFAGQELEELVRWHAHARLKLV